MRWLLPAAVLLAAPPGIAQTALPATRVASHDDLGQRRAIRGATIEGHESDELRALRRFEEEQLLPSLGAGPLSASEPPAAWASLALPDVPVRWDARVTRYLEFFKSDRRGRATMTSWLRAQGRYRARIEDALRRHHLPCALLYIAMIESGYDPLDRSFAGASGLWQFMPEAARIYGLRIDHWVDERNDPEKATEAQMRYFGDLFARFGSWHLALAAFNAGYGAALAACAKYNTNDYWALCQHEDGLPWETVLYVPKFIAAAIVGENRAAFGYDGVAADPPPAWDAVTVGASITLDEAARAAGVTAAEVAALNPELRRARTPPVAAWTLKLPPGTGPRFLARAASPNRDRERLATYTVRLGDRLESIARTRHTSAASLRRWNGIRDASEVRPGMVLLVPPPQRDKGEAGDAPTPPILAVADKDAIVEGKRRLFYRVAPGDGIADVASRFHVSDDDLTRWNRLDPRARLSSGLVLQLWVDPDLAVDSTAVPGLIDPATEPGARIVTAGSEEFFDLVEARRGRKRVVYTARAGDTLKRVGQRFGLGEGDMERINQIGRGAALRPGDKLVVYVAMTAAERAAAQRIGTACCDDGAGGEDDEPPVAAGGKVPADDVPARAAPVAVEDPGLASAPAEPTGDADPPIPPHVTLPTLPAVVQEQRAR